MSATFLLGTVYCGICGELFPLGSSAHTTLVCTACGETRLPTVAAAASSGAGSGVFSPDELSQARQAVKQRIQRLAVSDSVAGSVEVDNRVIEEAFCERCEKHTPCRSFARQTRSADEGQTIFFQCTVCKSEWQHNS